MFINKIIIKDIPDGDYAFSLPAIRSIIASDGLKLNSPVTFFAGENGSGKSTLLESVAVALGFNAEGGSRNFNFSTCRTHSNLNEAVSFSRTTIRIRDGYFLRAESFYNAATYIDEIDKIPSASRLIKESYGGESLHTKSHGESFMALVLERFGGHGIYILDEPEAALSPARQLSLLTRIGELVKLDSQFIIATHSPILMAFPDAYIYVFDDNGIRLTPYKETEHYTLTRRFLENPEHMLKYLLQ
jgi:predicted ATPase